MADTTSTRLWLEAARRSDHRALDRLWKRFSPKMSRLAAQWLASRPRFPGFDHDDVTQVAFDAFSAALAGGRYPDVGGSDELWRLLAVITVRKASDLAKAESAQRRGGDAVVVSLDDSGFAVTPPVSAEAAPELAAAMTDESRRLLRVLADPELETVALLKFEGYTNDEIAQKLGYTRRTIQRMLNRIKGVWRHEIEKNGEGGS
jgi:DNA-directed RNA polymerase specialized sigma24 family protein